MCETLYNFTYVCLHARVPIGVPVCPFVYMSELTSGGSTVYVLLVSECQFIWLYVKLPLCQTVYCSCGCLSVCVKWLYVRLYVGQKWLQGRNCTSRVCPNVCAYCILTVYCKVLCQYYMKGKMDLWIIANWTLYTYPLKLLNNIYVHTKGALLIC